MIKLDFFMLASEMPNTDGLIRPALPKRLDTSRIVGWDV
jgi:hypothetical protein